MRTSQSGLWQTLVGAAVFGAAMLAGAPAEAEAQESEVIYACYIPGPGVVYRVDGPDDACRGETHVAFNWNSEGPAGADGADGDDGEQGPTGADGADGGLAGHELVLANFTIPDIDPGVTFEQDLFCPGSKLVLGGGGRILGGSASLSISGYPNGSAAWRVVVRNLGSTTYNGGETLTVFVTCADVA